MYPNPAQDYVTVVVNKASTLELINTVGQVVLKRSVEGKSNISLSNMKSGMYIGKITAGNGDVEMHKIMIK
ncbi:MAG: T9SS type A sorting domain-containing protein [Bacteroidales bacterium]|nr:T9SS type A sorting domain-containing protein [Bacteroidales bacterium]MCF8406184.1 T9SS type A sorting domain-containing protein [Bacteroidales bacterium]